MTRCLKLIMLGIPWLMIWLLGTACALLADGFTWLQDGLRAMAEDINQEIQKL